MKIYINAPFLPENAELIRKAAGDCEIISDNADEADIIIGTPPENARLDSLKWLQLPFAGAESFCGDPRIAENVIMTNATGAFGEVISEYVTGAILAVFRRLFEYRDDQRCGVWRDIKRERSLRGSRALILGCGDIGGSTAEKLKAFGVYVTGIRKTPRPAEFFDEIYGTDALDKQLPLADIVICCLPHTAHTAGMLDEGRIGLMKRGALLVNVGRGSLIDENALIAALKEERLCGAVLDVFENEPLPADSPLWSLPNAFITPHISGVSFGQSPDTERKIAGICADNLERFRAGRPLRCVVDRKEGYVRS